jgi:predicted secreted protein
MHTLAVAAAALLAATPALAGDFADRAILGFSPDGATFAFEEFGVQDGSGFPYSNIYVIDTESDSWVRGTPVRVLVEDETATLAAARAKAHEAARAVLAAKNVTETGYRLVASNPPTELSADPHAVRFRPDLWANQLYAYHELKLTLLPMPEGEACASFGPIHGFRLDLSDADGNGRTLHADETLPSSRFCPLDYAITDVILYDPEGEAPEVLVVLLNLIRQGFEGPDRRYLAVAGPFHGH